MLPAILSRSGNLPARHPLDREPLQHGTIYVAPPDRHLLLDGDDVVLSRGPRENGYRPAIDVLFRSAARAVGARAIGVVLSGVLDDGTAGLLAIDAVGGAALVQDPDEAQHAAMPHNALAHVPTAEVAAAAKIPAVLDRLLEQEVPDAQSAPSLLVAEADIAGLDEGALLGLERPGMPSGFSCPDCSGVLYEIHDGAMTRYRCRVGHAWSPQALLSQQDDQLENALWVALRQLEEGAALTSGMAEQATERGMQHTARRYTATAREAAGAARVLRDLLKSSLITSSADRSTQAGDDRPPTGTTA
ncbi:MAG: chemotaxis protein CheB [Jatrophihabitans sp.]|uniref:chemotaxis protein CheB n=1 Tax=Jatrophihabitans sp. TaxID=1932789 RepID=UPI003F7E657C